MRLCVCVIAQNVRLSYLFHAMCARACVCVFARACHLAACMCSITFTTTIATPLPGNILFLPFCNLSCDPMDWIVFTANRPIVRDFVDDVITVEDQEIIEAMRLCYEILKVAVEPSGAIGLAAVLSDGFQKNPLWNDCKHVAIILSGGNVDLNVLWEALSK